MHPAIIVILVFWIAIILVSFGVNAPRHATMYAVFLILALALGSAMFLIFEMSDPFRGMMRISAEPVRAALANMLPEGR